jgi:prevent-host-death family protein
MKQSISDREFEAKCLDLIREVARTGRPIITKRGKPIARLDPVAKPRTLRGFYKDKLRIVGDIIGPLDTKWSADS